MSVFSDIGIKYEEFHKKVEEFPEAIDKAVGQNAAMALKETIVQIDALIYSTPESPTYKRTKNLRRSNKIKKLGPMAWLLYNDAEYAGAVHNGTSRVGPRPWMRNAIDAKQSDMTDNLVRAGLEALEGAETSVEATPELGAELTGDTP
jgi:HK97 gp10 family phage protein